MNKHRQKSVSNKVFNYRELDFFVAKTTDILKVKEEKLTKADLRRMHSEYNKMYFGGKLSMPEFMFITRKKPYGRFTSGKSVRIGISAYRKDWCEGKLENTLIHEMIHQYVSLVSTKKS